LGAKQTPVQNGVTTIYLGAIYEKNLSTSEVTTYYFAGSQRVAMRNASGLYYFVADHTAQRAAASRTRRGQHVAGAGCERIARSEHPLMGAVRSLSVRLHRMCLR
jgi:hypothetical protein